MSLGFEKAGFDVKWAVEKDPLTAATYKANSGSTHRVQVYQEDVKGFLIRSKQGHPSYPLPHEVDHIHGSTPCKGFSRANRSGGKNDLWNNKQTLLFIEAIRHFRPMTALLKMLQGS